ncbi:MAG: sigma-70 family RNA polymerase sigma factor [Chitinophagaceae bacterium]|nr:sigma-70 family RNA polymerase sigma factor [Chitinophagaceae bacterium]
MTVYTSYTDLQLLQSLRQSDEGAFTELYNRYWERLYRSAYRKLTDKEQAKEIVHDVLVDIWRRREDLSIEYLPAYLEKAVRFRTINYISRHQAPAFFDLFETALRSPFEADSQINMQEFMRLLEAWIELLPEKRRRIFIKYYFENLSAREIAREMDLPLKTVQNNISLALQYLRNRFSHLLVLMILMSHNILS